MDAFKRAEYQSVIDGNIALLPCCMFVDIQREYGAESDYKHKADQLHKRKIDLCDEVHVLNVDGYIGESTRSEIDYANYIGKPVRYLICPKCGYTLEDAQTHGDHLLCGYPLPI
jgi:rubrerythrin